MIQERTVAGMNTTVCKTRFANQRIICYICIPNVMPTEACENVVDLKPSFLITLAGFYPTAFVGHS